MFDEHTIQRSLLEISSRSSRRSSDEDAYTAPGGKVAMKCEGCGKTIDSAAKFCPECGAAQRLYSVSQDGAQIATIVGLDVLSFSVPRHPDLPSPDKKDVLAGGTFLQLDGKTWGWKAAAYRGAAIPPAAGSLICPGFMVPFN